MAEDNGSGVINIQPQQQKAASLSDLMSNPLVKEFVLPIAKNELKKSFGINANDNRDKMGKSGWRALYYIRDFIQGTYWVLLLSMAVLGLMIIAFRVLSKWAGV